MIDIIKYKERIYPKFQSEGFSSQFAIPYAKHVCKGLGYDIGCLKKEWAFPGSIPIDKSFDDEYDALNLPQLNVDYIFSSHCLEHVERWVDVLDFWGTVLKIGGVLFLYLPHFNQEYWRPWNNRKHIHCFTPEIIKSYYTSNGYTNIFCSDRDLNDSFMIFGEKND